MEINRANLISEMINGNIGVQTPGQEDQTGRSSLSGFTDILKEQLDKTNELAVVSDEATQLLAIGEADNIEDVMIKAEEARLALDLTIQVRNKLMESYQEIMRMQM